MSLQARRVLIAVVYVGNENPLQSEDDFLEMLSQEDRLIAVPVQGVYFLEAEEQTLYRLRSASADWSLLHSESSCPGINQAREDGWHTSSGL